MSNTKQGACGLFVGGVLAPLGPDCGKPRGHVGPCAERCERCSGTSLIDSWECTVPCPDCAPMSEPKKLPDHMAETLSGDGTTRQLDLWYPRVEGNPAFVELGLMDVRAADSIRISYDFERDGWKVEQASTFEWMADDKVCDPAWQEVAFIQAWGREQATAMPEPQGAPRPGATTIMFDGSEVMGTPVKGAPYNIDETDAVAGRVR